MCTQRLEHVQHECSFYAEHETAYDLASVNSLYPFDDCSPQFGASLTRIPPQAICNGVQLLQIQKAFDWHVPPPYSAVACMEWWDHAATYFLQNIFSLHCSDTSCHNLFKTSLVFFQSAVLPELYTYAHIWNCHMFSKLENTVVVKTITPPDPCPDHWWHWARRSYITTPPCSEATHACQG